MAYSIVILDDHPLIVESLTTIVSLMEDVETIKAFSTAKTFYDDEKTFLNDLYIIDISLGVEDGRDVMKQIRKKHTEAKIIALSSHDHPRIIQSAFRSGADSYLLKTSSASEIKTCIETLLKSEDYLPSNIQKILQNHLKGQKYETNPNFPTLTSREQEVLQLIAEELTSKEIGEKLHLSEFTIEGHRATLFQKFDVKNIAGLMRKAILAGAID